MKELSFGRASWATLVLVLVLTAGCQASESDRSSAPIRQTKQIVMNDLGHGTVSMEYECVEGQAVAGDILVAATCEEADSDLLGYVVPSYGRWPGGIIPYVIDPEWPNVEVVIREMRVWELQTSIKFVERTTENDYVRIMVNHETGVGGRSSVGRSGGAQKLTSDSGGSALQHELGHAIGLMHEHQRPDRDTYIKVNLDAVGAILKSAYSIANGYTPVGPYDYQSVMHYPIGSDGSEIVLRSGGAFRGSPYLSDQDHETVNTIYGLAPVDRPEETEIVYARKILPLIQNQVSGCRLRLEYVDQIAKNGMRNVHIGSYTNMDKPETATVWSAGAQFFDDLDLEANAKAFLAGIPRFYLENCKKI